MPPRLLFALLSLLALPLTAQTTLADLQTRLVHQPLYLRGQWIDDQLTFDATGHLVGSSALLPFTLSGVDIDSLKIERQGLSLRGNRVGLEFRGDTIVRSDVMVGRWPAVKRESIRIDIQPPVNGDYNAALDSIFTADLATFVPTLPTYWQQYGKEHLLPVPVVSTEGTPPASTLNASGGSQATSELPVRRVGGSVSPPHPLKMPEPDFTPQARSKMISGKVLVYLQVDTHGKPMKVRILKPVGYGLDERAIGAVSQYKFEPAKENGVPIPVEMNVQVNFQIY